MSVTLELLPLDKAALGQSKAARRQQAVQARDAAAAAAEARQQGSPKRSWELAAFLREQSSCSGAVLLNICLQIR